MDKKTKQIKERAWTCWGIFALVCITAIFIPTTDGLSVPELIVGLAQVVLSVMLLTYGIRLTARKEYVFGIITTVLSGTLNLLWLLSFCYGFYLGMIGA